MDSARRGDAHSTVIRIPKKDGGIRIIHKPDQELHARLKKILAMLKNHRLSFGPFVHGFVRRRSIKTNAQALMVYDENKNPRPLTYMLKLDIIDYFHHVTEGLVQRVLRKEHLPDWEIEIIMDSCIVSKDVPNPCLPQGFPTSPFLAALLMKYLSFRLYGLCKRISPAFQTKMAIYADNITFASDSSEVRSFGNPVNYILEKFGMESKYAKFVSTKGRMIVCGVQLNKDGVGPPRKYWRTLRAEIFNACRDRQAGLVPAGFRLSVSDRDQLRKNAQIAGVPGLVKKKLLSNDVKDALKKAKKRAVPISFEEWRGKIEFIRSLDPDKGESLMNLFKETCRWHQYNPI
jgi:hypothetical protein